MLGRLDWQHVALFAMGAGCVTAIILLGKGQTLVQIFAAVGGLSGVLALLKRSPAEAPKDGGS